jgi:hypothetical protein
MIERQRQHQATRDLDRHRGRHEDASVCECVPEAAVGQRFGIVGESEIWPPQPRHAQIVEVQ